MPPNSTTAEGRLAQLGIKLPAPPEPFGMYADPVPPGVWRRKSSARHPGRTGSHLRSATRVTDMYHLRMSWLCLFGAVLALSSDTLAQPKESSMAQHVSYRTLKVDGLNIFYREAGPKDAPTILLLHGLPSSSRMFEPLLTRLAGQFHLVDPDYPGFGHSDAPTPKEFSYTFDNIAKVMDHFTETLSLT